MRQLIRKKIRKAVLYATNRRQIMLHSIVCWAARPIDNLWHHTCSEKQPVSIADLMRDDNSPLNQCLLELSETVLEPLPDGPLGLVWNHMMLDVGLEDERWILNELLKRLASMVCQLHSRLLLPFQSWPYKLVTIVDPDQPHFLAVRRGRLEEFLQEPICCLDEHFSHKLRTHFIHQTAGLDRDELKIFDELYFKALFLWAQHTKLSNMSTERLLARCKRSVPEGSPNLERFLCSSYLSLWLSKHLEAAGRDPRATVSKKTLEEQGLLQPPKKKRKAPSTQGANGLFTYIRSHMPETTSASAKRQEHSRSAHILGRRRRNIKVLVSTPKSSYV